MKIIFKVKIQKESFIDVRLGCEKHNYPSLIDVRVHEESFLYATKYLVFLKMLWIKVSCYILVGFT
jgi:hypothetical protein